MRGTRPGFQGFLRFGWPFESATGALFSHFAGELSFISVLVMFCCINVLRKKWVLNILLLKQIGKNMQFPHSRTVGEMEGFPSQEIAAVCFPGSTCQESEQVGPGAVDS